ncbi:MAG TPA: hypothetical protein VN493_06325 [Thermoanaerobaculia bacterium]|nr:hypothetical protein [Thermoanaerobaculia bacterium]
MNKSRAVAVVLLCLVGAGSLPAAPRKAQDRTGQVIFKDVASEDLSRTRILKVTVVQELPDALVVDVEYNRASDYEGELGLSVIPDMPHWSVTHIHLQPGRHIVSQEIAIQEEVKAPQTSNNLSIQIQHYQDRKYKGEIFTRIVPFEKVWKPRQR